MNSKEAMNQSVKKETFAIAVTSFPFYYSQVGEVKLIITQLLQLRELKQRESKVSRKWSTRSLASGLRLFTQAVGGKVKVIPQGA